MKTFYKKTILLSMLFVFGYSFLNAQKNSVTLISPSGGELINQDYIPVSWEVDEINDSLDVFLWDGTFMSQIASNIPNYLGEADCLIPSSIMSERCRVMIVRHDSNLKHITFSPSYFTINYVEPSILFTADKTQYTTENQVYKAILYPNPAKSCIDIEFNFDIESSKKIEVLDIASKQINFNYYFKDSKTFTIDVSSFPNGIYFLIISLPNISDLKLKFVVYH